jgi:hypothetical protein
MAIHVYNLHFHLKMTCLMFCCSSVICKISHQNDTHMYIHYICDIERNTCACHIKKKVKNTPWPDQLWQHGIQFSLFSTYYNLSSLRKTFWQTSLHSILEEFFLFLLYNFYAICISLNQFLLDWGIRLVVFGADCLSSGTERQKHTLTHLIYDCMQCSFPFFSHELTIIGTTMQRKQKFGPNWKIKRTCWFFVVLEHVT